MRENPEQRQVGGGTPSGEALQPNGALGDLPSHPQGREGSRDPTLGAAEGMPGGKYLPALTSAAQASGLMDRTCRARLPNRRDAGGHASRGSAGSR